jgi:KDO2-lipid IV(A) lauroyltransferase
VNPTLPDFKPSRFLHPRHWPTWLMLGLMWLAAQLPYRAQLALGSALGMLMYALARRRRQITQINIDVAFPHYNAAQRHQLLLQSLRNSAISLMEIGLSWWGDEKRLNNLLHLEGLEHIQAALQQGKGVILLGGHFTSLIIAGRLLALRLPFNILIKQARNPLFEAVMHYYRSRQYHGVIDLADMRRLIKALHNNEVCWYAPDQDLGREKSVFAPFMGVQTATLKSTAKLAKATGATVVYIDYERLPGSQGYRLKIHPPLEDFPGGDDVEDARRVNALIEQHVHQVPDQYFWVHRRFKTRPPGEAEFYQKNGRPL